MKLFKIALALILVPTTFGITAAANADECSYVPGSCQEVVIVTDLPDELQERSYAATVDVDGVRRLAECARLSLNQTLCVLEPPPFVAATSAPVPSFTG